ncbi:MAG: N-6 DNA methylase, partial [Erysipelotrichaceae bacterium]|nr:N-6 DNA methylase [Erysipelotrichaceae bacterium]
FITHGHDLGNAKNGFVLTPRHICELFAELGEVNKDTKMLDMCFGTAGFLVAGMQKAVEDSKGDATAIQNIKNNNICGVELDGDRFTYGCVNMILRGDGQSNMEQGDCFNESIKNTMKAKKCKVGFINPPYSLKTRNELEFVENMLDCLEEGGRGIAIIPMNRATDKSNKIIPIKQSILKKHTLEAVLSMPKQLFYPVGTETCIMIFTAHKPHNSDKKSWFADCKNDGLVIDRKSKGRADINNKWEDIKKQWVNAFTNRDELPGFSVKQSVTANDDWSYEKYAKIDLDGITEDSFKKVVKEYALFQMSQLEV